LRVQKLQMKIKLHTYVKLRDNLLEPQ